MPDIFGILMTGQDALLTQQKAVDVTGHNIANVNTVGYTRQRVNLSTKEPIDGCPGQMGTGVRAEEIQRIHDRFLGVQITRENEDLGRWEAQKNSMDRVEMVFDESDGYGLGQVMTDFWSAWQDLANNPSGQAERFVVRERSTVLAETFNTMHADLEALQKELDVNIAGTVKDINGISVQIADLNQKIAVAEVRGQNANDFRDTRDELLKGLSGLVDIQTFENNDGQVTVLLQSGRPLVESGRSWELSTGTGDAGLTSIAWVDPDGNAVDITSSIHGGKLKGWLEVRDGAIPAYLRQLDELAGTIIDQVNRVHEAGYGLEDPVTGTPSTGVAFFSGSSAADMAVNAEILNDAGKIAASASASGVPGDNSNALALAGLQQALVMNGDTATFEDWYSTMVGVVGADVQEADLYFQHQTSVMDQLSNYRESISGVSIDEEMVNLIKFQNAYEAAAKLITTVDEMLTSLLTMR